MSSNTVLRDTVLSDLVNYKLQSGINPLECKGNYSATSNNMTLLHWPLTAK